MKNIEKFFPLLETCNEESNPKYAGLVNGKAGLFLCIDKLSHVNKSNRLSEWRNKLLNTLLTTVTSQFSLANGIAGLCMTFQFSSYKEILSDQLAQLHHVLREKCNLLIERKEYDYFNGASGILFYLILYSNDRIECLLKKYCGTLSNDIQNHAFRSRIYDEKKTIIGTNIGTAHGLTGYLLVLLAAWEQGYKDIVSSTVGKLAEFLLAHRLKETGFPQFPSFIDIDNNKYQSDIAWCYGDLMSWYAIWKYANLDNNVPMLEMSYGHLIEITKRPDIRNNCIILCHGLPSIYLVYRHLYKKTQDKKFLMYARIIRQQIIDLLASYPSRVQNDEQLKKEMGSPSLFIGLPGCLMSLYIDEFDDEWTKVLLL